MIRTDLPIRIEPRAPRQTLRFRSSYCADGLHKECLGCNCACGHNKKPKVAA